MSDWKKSASGGLRCWFVCSPQMRRRNGHEAILFHSENRHWHFIRIRANSSISVLLLAFVLVASMVNVLTKGTLLTDNGFMQALYAWSQCIGIDASIPGAIMRTSHYYRQQNWLSAGLYTLPSALLLFTTCLVSNIESTQKTSESLLLWFKRIRGTLKLLKKLRNTLLAS